MSLYWRCKRVETRAANSRDARGINAYWTNERGSSAVGVVGAHKERERRTGRGRYCYLRFIVITDGTSSVASEWWSYNHPLSFHRLPSASLSFSLELQRTSALRSLSDLRRGGAAMQICIAPYRFAPAEPPCPCLFGPLCHSALAASARRCVQVHK